MAVLEIDTTRRKGAVKGRESRNQTLNTKLTPTEAAAVETAAKANGKAVGEWLRDLALQESGRHMLASYAEGTTEQP